MIERYQQGCVEVIVLDDRFTAAEVETARPLLSAALQQRIPQMVLDLRKVRLVDSSGLELICEIAAGCSRRGGALRLAGAKPLLRDVLLVTGLDQEIPLHEDVVGAAGAFAL